MYIEYYFKVRLVNGKGTFNLEMYDVASETCISGSDYIVVD